MYRTIETVGVFVAGLTLATLIFVQPFIKVGPTPDDLTIFHQNTIPVQENLNAKNYIHGVVYGNYQEIFDSYDSFTQINEKNSSPSYFQDNDKFYKDLLKNRKAQIITYLGGKQLPNYGIFLYETVITSNDNTSTDWIWIIITDDTGKVSDVK